MKLETKKIRKKKKKQTRKQKQNRMEFFSILHHYENRAYQRYSNGNNDELHHDLKYIQIH